MIIDNIMMQVWSFDRWRTAKDDVESGARVSQIGRPAPRPGWVACSWNVTVDMECISNVEFMFSTSIALFYILYTSCIMQD